MARPLSLLRRVSPRVQWAISVAAVILAFAILGIVARAVAPTPSGPPLSSYATTPTGVAAWAELLARDGHPVRRLRRPLASADLPYDATLVLLGGQQNVTPADARALRNFLAGGGRLVLGGAAANGADHVSGDVITVSRPAFLENGGLARGDNALHALKLAGARGRPVLFDEDIHGYGPAIGLAALPTRWWFALVLLAAAFGAWALSRAIRLGGSDPVPPESARPRVAYVQAMARTLIRTENRAKLAERAQAATATESAFRRTL